MKAIYYVLTIMLIGAQQAYSWGWQPRGRSAKAPGAVTWRSAGFVRNNKDLNEACNKACVNKREQWTTQWKTSWRGSTDCACKVPVKKSIFARQKPEEKPHDVAYRSAGVFKVPEDLAHHCPKVCGSHDEKFTGNWDHRWIGGYRCECKPDASLIKGKVAGEVSKVERALAR